MAYLEILITNLESIMETKKVEVSNKFKYFCFLLIYFFIYPFAKLLYGRKKNWLICERGFDAQDNGFLFFKYLNENHKEINSVYLIKKDCPEYNNIKKIGKVIEFGSIKHFIYAIGFPVKISSQLYGYAPWITMYTYFKRNKTYDKHVFLQHGIIKNFHSAFLKENCRSLTTFICGAYPEYEYVLKEFGYTDEVVKYTGFSRYDFLESKEKKQILLMPTWRAKLVNLSFDDFKKTDFFKSWSLLINDKKILEKCKEKGYTIKFYIHIQLRKFINCFEGNEVVKIIPYDSETVQTLLNESCLLVTDFSSVYFDFIYEKKPVIYYQFDESTFNKEHYEKGYFDYRRDGFGKVCNNVNDCRVEFLKLLDCMKLDSLYLERSRRYFVYNDKNNNERIFSVINN